jgi:hypothetical protein
MKRGNNIRTEVSEMMFLRHRRGEVIRKTAKRNYKRKMKYFSSE